MKPQSDQPAPEHPAVDVSASEIVEQAPYLRRVLRRLGVRCADLDDEVQETILRAWQSAKAGRFCPPTDIPLQEGLRRWLYGIAWYHVTHYRKAAARRLVPVGNWIEPMGGPDPVDQLDAREALRALQRLRPEWRAVLVNAVMGLSAKTTAARLGIPVGTVRNRLRAARTKFAKLMTVDPLRRPEVLEKRLKYSRVAPRTKAGPRDPAERWDPAFPEAPEVMAEIAHVREYLRRARSVASADLDDLMQEVAISAILAIADGRYTPKPSLKPHFVLRRWLIGIAVRQLDHMLRRAYRWREVSCWDSWWDENGPAEHPGPREDAREVLATLEDVPWSMLKFLLLSAQGFVLVEIARIFSISVSTAVRRIHQARQRFAAMLHEREF